MMGWTFCTGWIIILQLITKALCLKDLKITVPEAVASGDTAAISCEYDLENAALYSLRWYFNAVEFYRYIPKESPPSKAYKIPSGLTVDTTKSGERTVTLRSLTRDQSGNYQCEVSADAPLFHTLSKNATMLVVELPDNKPTVTVTGTLSPTDNRRFVTMGESVKATCVSGPSYPAVNFTWIINGVRYPSSHSGLREVSKIHNNINNNNNNNNNNKFNNNNNDNNSNNYNHNNYNYNYNNHLSVLSSSALVTSMSSSASATSSLGWKSYEVFSEIQFNADLPKMPDNNRQMLIRCETNIFSLYKGAAVTELHILEDHSHTNGFKVSPTTDQRGGAAHRNGGDPDNSALTGSSAIFLFSSCNFGKYFLLKLAIIWLIIVLLS